MQAVLEPLRDAKGTHPCSPGLERWPHNSALEASGLPDSQQLRRLPPTAFGPAWKWAECVSLGRCLGDWLGGTEEQRGETQKNL